MDKFKIIGGEKLYGEIEINSAKNALLPILSASIMSEGMVEIDKIVLYQDVFVLFEILKTLGANLTLIGDKVYIDSSKIHKYELSKDITSRCRASIFCLGPMLARFKKAIICHPGGCEIGKRPIDIHINAFKSLKVSIQDIDGTLICDSGNAKSGRVKLSFPSVGATENIVMFACTLKGTTIIENCAKEPEIVDLCNFLNSMGANIKGQGTNKIVIQGVKSLKSTKFTAIPDRIIAGTYLIAGAICGGHIQVKNAKAEHIAPLLKILKNIGCKIYIDSDKIDIVRGRTLKSIKYVQTQPYPYFATDLQPQLVSLLALTNGISTVEETLFESRFKYVEELNKMGANIVVKGQTATITGVKDLNGCSVVGKDLRGGVALVLAGLSAIGETEVSGVNYIDRGYYRLEDDLKRLGAKITRVNEE